MSRLSILRTLCAHWRTSILMRTVAVAATATVALTLVTAAVVFQGAEKDALVEQDARLSDIAVAMARGELGTVLPRALTMPQAQFEARLESDEPLPRPRRMHRHMMAHCPTAASDDPNAPRLIPAGSPVYVRMLNDQGRAKRAVFDEPVEGGLTTRTIKGETYRMAVLFLPGGRYTAVADPVSTREVYARSAAMTAVLPILILLPVLVIVIGLTLWRMLAPIRSAARAAAERPATDLTPLPSEGVPAEVKPFVEAVNSLLGRVSEARTRELRFTADAAHELRSPLTSLTIEAEHLGRLDLPAEARPVVARLESGLERAVKQVSQLLQFARAQAGEAPEILRRDTRPWYLSELLGEILEPLMNCAADKDLQFDVEGLDDGAEAPVEGVSRAALLAILRNLLENAFHYTPAGGSVTLRVSRTPEPRDERGRHGPRHCARGAFARLRSLLPRHGFRASGHGPRPCDREDLRRHDGRRGDARRHGAGRHASRPDGDGQLSSAARRLISRLRRAVVRTVSTVKTTTAVQISTKPVIISTEKGSPNAKRPSRKTMVGLTYWMIPTVE